MSLVLWSDNSITLTLARTFEGIFASEEWFLGEALKSELLSCFPSVSTYLTRTSPKEGTGQGKDGAGKVSSAGSDWWWATIWVRSHQLTKVRSYFSTVHALVKNPDCWVYPHPAEPESLGIRCRRVTLSQRQFWWKALKRYMSEAFQCCLLASRELMHPSGLWDVICIARDHFSSGRLYKGSTNPFSLLLLIGLPL